MAIINDQLTSIISDVVAVLATTKENEAILPVVELERPTDTNHGDFATNVAMIYFSQLKKAGVAHTYSSPRALAEAIVEGIKKQIAQVSDNVGLSIVSEVSVAGPGFINLRLNDAYLLQELPAYISEEKLSQKVRLPNWDGKKVMVEFTDPNPFKELHIGHAYSNSVGEAISRLLKAVGATVYQACYQGDVGMHVAKSIWGLLNSVLPVMPEYQQLLEKKSQLEAVTEVLALLESTKSPLKADVPVDTLAELLGKAYAAGATAYTDDESTQEIMKRINFLTFLSAQERLVQEDNWQPQVDYSQYVDPSDELYPIVKVIFQTCRRWSMEYFELMYGKLGMEQKANGKYFDYYFAESVVGEYGLKIVQANLAKGIFKKSDGAIIFPGSEYGLHDRVFVNSLGLPTYEAKELGLAPEKYRLVPYDASIILTGNEIDEYFKVLLKALEQIRPDLAAKTTHMSHGMVRLPEGKMSSRTGNVITTLEVLESAIAKIQETLNANETTMSAELQNEVAAKVGLGAIKYAFLKHSIGSDIAFSFEESLSFSGQSGPYLQYTHVRCQSILEKSGYESSSADQVENVDQLKLADQLKTTISEIKLTTYERAVLSILTQFPESITKAATEFAPHVVAHYLFELAQAFSVFYTNCQILKEENQEQRLFRLQLTKATAVVLAKGMALLGIETVPQM